MTGYGLEQYAQLAMIGGTAASMRAQHIQAKYARQSRADAIAHNLKIQKRAEAAQRQQDQTLPEQATESFLIKDLMSIAEGGRGYGKTIKDRLTINPGGSY